MDKQKVLVIVGPTAVGKTALGVKLSQRFNGEVISGDSLQVYKQLDIGTAKVTTEEMQGVPHHLIDIKEPTETYSAHEFKRHATECINELALQNKLPIIVGGTGLYIQSLLYDFHLGSSELSDDEKKSRKKWEEFAENLSNEELWQELEKMDKKGADTIHPNNRKRVIRALEVFDLTGKSISEQQQIDLMDLSKSSFDMKLIGLTTDREVLYNRINQRVDIMMDEGLLDEAKMVYELDCPQASQGIGYKEFFPYFEGKCSLEKSVEEVKQHSRQYAKRQLTWFRNRMPVEWWDIVLDETNMSKLEEAVSKWLDMKEGMT